MTLDGLRIALVGPLPPPEGGMANQTRQLGELLQAEGAQVTLVRTNAPYRPAWIARLRGVRALFRLLHYIVELWRVAGRADLYHIVANSGWSWHVFAAPAVWVARLRGIPSVVNYRGGEAERFLERSAPVVRMTLRRATRLAVPSGFLQQVFARRAIQSEIVPNIVDLSRFRPAHRAQAGGSPHLLVARSLEPIYDIATALRAFALVRKEWPGARLTLAGAGPEKQALHSLAAELGVSDAVHFPGRLGRDEMAELYRSACVVMNPSRVDNMPNSILEAMASGTPVVSTDVGGIPFIVRHGITGLLVGAGDHAAMALAVQRLLRDPQCARRLSDNALEEAQQYAWPRVRQQWARVYMSVLSGTPAAVRAS